MSQRDQDVSAKLRDHLANERTFLAWIRTCIALIALGFVIERFSLIVEAMIPQLAAVGIAPRLSATFGTVIVAAGGILIVFSTFRFIRTNRRIEAGTYRSSSGLDISLAVFTVIIAIALVIYLIRQSVLFT